MKSHLFLQMQEKIEIQYSSMNLILIGIAVIIRG